MKKTEQTHNTKLQKNSSVSVSANYHAWLESLKKQIQSARARTALIVNAELINLYHKIGLDILQQQQTHRWGRQNHPTPRC